MGIIDTATGPLRQGAGTAFKVGGWAVQQIRGRFDQQQQADTEQQEQQEEQRQNQRTTRPTRQASRRPKDLDDATIARKVESTIYAVKGVDKGKINVNVVDGVAELRGTAKNAAIITAIVAAAEAIPEVDRVENLLRQPKTPARKAKPKRNQMPRTEPRRLNADKTVEQNEDLPEVIAEQGKGRQPAPLGAKGGSEKSTKPTPAEKGRFGRDAGGEDSGAPKRPTTGVGTKSGPPAGGGEVVS